MSDYGTPTISGGWELTRKLRLPDDFPSDEDVEAATAGMIARQVAPQFVKVPAMPRSRRSTTTGRELPAGNVSPAPVA